MIKIKKIAANQFYDNLNKCANRHENHLKVFGKNYYTNWDKGVYYSTDKNKTIMYYETAERNKFGNISEDKTFLICWQLKIGKSDWFIALLLTRVIFLLILILEVIAMIVFDGISMQTIFAGFIFMLVGVYVSHFSQAINLLNFFDEITQENKE